MTDGAIRTCSCSLVNSPPQGGADQAALLDYGSTEPAAQLDELRSSPR